jgi:hypothetical protein
MDVMPYVRSECKRKWGTSSQLYFRIDELLRELANPNLHAIFSTSEFQVELWDQHAGHIRVGRRCHRVDHHRPRSI